MITPDQIRADGTAAAPIIANAANIASGLAPEYAGLILLGASVAKQAPNLLADAIEIFQAAEPTAAQEAALDAKTAVLKTI